MNRKPRNNQRPTLKVYLPPDLHQSLEAQSNASGLSKSEIMRRLIRNDLNNDLCVSVPLCEASSQNSLS